MDNKPSEVNKAPTVDQPVEAPTAPAVESAPIQAAPVGPVATEAQPVKAESLAHKINRITAIILIVSGIVFVLIAILAIWQVFGEDNGEVVWRALGSLGAIALGALIVSVASKLVDQRS